MRNLMHFLLYLLMVHDCLGQSVHSLNLFDESGCKNNPSFHITNIRIDQLQNGQNAIDYNFESIRAISEVNVSGSADGYPWISSDGLRKYFTRGTELTNENSIMFTQRSTFDDQFSAPLLIPISVPGLNSCWLSEDELDMYILGDSVYRCSRNNINESFSPPSLVHLSYSFKGGFVAINLNKDQSSLYLRAVTPTFDGMVEFERTAPNSFRFKRKINKPLDFDLKTGVLSKDNLTMFLTLGNSNFRGLIYQMNRTTESDTFSVSSLKKIIGVSDTTIYNGQACASQDTRILVFARSNNKRWDGNDLFLAQRAKVTDEQVGSTFSGRNNIRVMPNPAEGKFEIEVNNEEIIEVIIYTLFGKSVYKNDSDIPIKTPMKFDFTNNPKGVYFIKLTNRYKKIHIEKLILD